MVIYRSKMLIFDILLKIFAKKFGSLKNVRTFAIPNGKNAEIAQLVEHNLAKVGVASSSLVFRSKSKSFEDKIKQNPLKRCFKGFFICCRSVSFRHRGAPTRQSPNLEVSLRISTVKIRDTYSEMRGHFDNLGQRNQLLANFSDWQLPTL